MPKGLYTALGQSLAASKALKGRAAAMESQKSLIKWEGERERKQFDEMLASGVELFKIGKEIKKHNEQQTKIANFAEEQGLTKQKDAWWKPAKWVNEQGTEQTTADILARGHFQEQENISKYGNDWTSLSPTERRKMSQVAGDAEKYKKEFYGTYDEESGETTYDSKYSTLSGEDMVKNYMAHGSFKGKRNITPFPTDEEINASQPGALTPDQQAQVDAANAKKADAYQEVQRKSFRQMQSMKRMGNFGGRETDIREAWGNLDEKTHQELAAKYDIEVGKANAWEEKRATMSNDPDDEYLDIKLPTDKFSDMRNKIDIGVIEGIFEKGYTLEQHWDKQDKATEALKNAPPPAPVRPDIPIEPEVEDISEDLEVPDVDVFADTAPYDPLAEEERDYYAAQEEGTVGWYEEGGGGMGESSRALTGEISEQPVPYDIWKQWESPIGDEYDSASQAFSRQVSQSPYTKSPQRQKGVKDQMKLWKQYTGNQ